MKASKFALLCSLVFGIGSVFMGCSSNQSQTGSQEADKALQSMNEMVKQFPDKKGFHKVLQHWNFSMPSGELFEWSRNSSANQADYAVVLMSDEFTKAGLDLQKMDKEKWLIKPAEVDNGKQLPNRLIKPYNVSDKNESADGSEDSLRRLFKQNPDIVKEDKATNSYALILGDGIEVRWAQTLGKGEYDMAFVLNAQPFALAGLDLKKIQESGWIFTGETSKAASSSEGSRGELIKKFKLK